MDDTLLGAHTRANTSESSSVLSPLPTIVPFNQSSPTFLSLAAWREKEEQGNVHARMPAHTHAHMHKMDTCMVAALAAAHMHKWPHTPMTVLVAMLGPAHMHKRAASTYVTLAAVLAPHACANRAISTRAAALA